MAIGLTAQEALVILEGMRAQQALLRQDPQWRDTCYSCGADNAPEGADGPNLRQGWDCYWCGSN